jgi:hypothetical protein
VQALDERIGDALEDVPLPAGLADRILARLSEQAATEEQQSAVPAESVVPAAAASRRSWLRWSAGLAAAASVAGIIAVALWPTQPAITAANINEQVRQFSDQEQPQSASSIDKGLPRGYPLSRHVYRMPRTQWRPVHGFLNRSDVNGVAYEMMFRGFTAQLYVAPLAVEGLPNSPPLRLDNVTGNRAIAAWQENGLLYVLVVQGDNRAYQSFIRRPVTT